ncbi:MAG: L-lactate permease [Pararhodobacter sp.]|nr:L-lactate permease [Pararhodobacter sp.]
MEPNVPTDLLHWIAALASIILLLILLVGLRWKSTEAGPVGLFVAIIVSVVLFQTPFDTISVALGKGVWDSIFILYVIWPALLLYVIVDRAGGFDALRAGIVRFSRNDLFLVMAFGWVFASFLQGIAGFGVPIAVVAPLLFALGVKPIYAVAIPLIGHSWANMFGTIAVSWLATNQVIEIGDPTATAWQTAALLWIVNIAGGLMIAWIYGRWAAMSHAMPMILIISLIHGGGQLMLVFWNPIVSNFVAGTVALLALYFLSNWKRYDEPHEDFDSPIMEGKGTSEAQEEAAEKVKHEPVMGLGMATFPYIVLIVVTLGGLLIPPIEQALGALRVGIPFHEVGTGYGVVREGTESFKPFALFTHPGTFILAAAIISWLVYRSQGYFEAWKKIKKPEGIWKGVTDGALPASVAVISFLTMSTVFDHSGQTESLAMGISDAVPPMGYAFAASFIGLLGAFMTSSNTASNVLFSGLQQNVAQLQGLSEPAIIAAQSAGGALGNSIAPANAVLGTGTTGISGREGEVLRVTLPWAIAVAVLLGLGTMFFATLGG